MGPVDYARVIVKKPWGHEYLMFQNGVVGVWYLHIRHGDRTSLHCHPHKKTGLILLDGEAVVSFLNDSVPITPVSKLNIRPGLFHSTAAVSPRGIGVIEVETPYDKENLVRLDDDYGRDESSYEGTRHTVPCDETCLQLQDPPLGRPATSTLHGCALTMERLADASGFKRRRPDEIIIVLEGGLMSSTGEPVLSPGDVVSVGTVERLAETFAAPKGAAILTIRRLA